MPGGKATKPGDVVKAMNGKTIQVNRLKLSLVTLTQRKIYILLYFVELDRLTTPMQRAV